MTLRNGKTLPIVPEVYRLPFFLLGVVLPWKRYQPAYRDWEWNCAIGCWIFIWRAEYRL